MNVPKVNYEILYNGKNITEDVLPFALSFSYQDKTAGEADEIELTLEDTAELWKGAWYPEKGDKIEARIFAPEGTLNCGVFEVDELQAGKDIGSGDTFTIKAIAAGINKKVRTKGSYAHENKTLREIAATVAAKHGFKVVGDIEDVRIARVTQYRETDLKFLQRLAGEYGYTFSIRGEQLIFTNVFEVENRAEALSINREEVISYSITDKTAHTYREAKVSYHNPRQKKVITHGVSETEPAYSGAKSDTLEIRVKAENEQQAELKARVALYRANSLQQEGTIEMPGNVLALAGNNCSLAGAGRFGGKYYIFTSKHSVDKAGGYTTSLEVKRVGLAMKELAERRASEKKRKEREEKKRNNSDF